MMDKKKTLDKKIEKLSLKKYFKKQKLQERGITLIALVVTIIILLILAGVTLNIALSDNGLFSKAKKAAEEYKEAQSEEEDLISQFAKQMYSEYVGAYVTFGDSIQIGKTDGSVEMTTDDEVIKNFEEREKDEVQSMKWRIWDYDGDTLRLISEKPTKENLTLKGAEGYNKGVYEINQICRDLFKLYDEEDNEIKGVSAANLRRSDIERVSTYDYTKYKQTTSSNDEVTEDNIDEDLIHYGESGKLKEGAFVPSLWFEHDKDWNYEYNEDLDIATGESSCVIPWEEEYKNAVESDNIVDGSGIDGKESYYNHIYSKDEFGNPDYFNILTDNGATNGLGYSWLATRYSQCATGGGWFGLMTCKAWPDYLQVQGAGLASTLPSERTEGMRLRPVISIKLSASGLTLKNTNSENSEYELVKKTD